MLKWISKSVEDLELTLEHISKYRYLNQILYFQN